MKLITNQLIKFNKHRVPYVQGEAYSEAKYVSMVMEYWKEMGQNGKCTERRLASLCGPLQATAHKAIKYAHQGSINNVKVRTSKRGIGVVRELTFEQHRFIYDTYLRNPASTRETYVRTFYDMFGVALSLQFISRWFLGVGPFKGSFQKASCFPSAKYTHAKKLKRHMITLKSN